MLKNGGGGSGSLSLYLVKEVLKSFKESIQNLKIKKNSSFSKGIVRNLKRSLKKFKNPLGCQSHWHLASLVLLYLNIQFIYMVYIFQVIIIRQTVTTRIEI